MRTSNNILRGIVFSVIVVNSTLMSAAASANHEDVTDTDCNGVVCDIVIADIASGPIVCITAEGCPTTLLNESDVLDKDCSGVVCDIFIDDVAAIGSGGPIVCVTAEGCPTTLLSESGAPVTDWPEFGNGTRMATEELLLAGEITIEGSTSSSGETTISASITFTI